MYSGYTFPIPLPSEKSEQIAMCLENHLFKAFEVFERLNKYNLKIQLTKSKIFTNKLKILRVIFSKQGQTIDPEKIAAIKRGAV